MISFNSFRQWRLCFGGLRLGLLLGLLLGIALAACPSSGSEFVSASGRFRVDMGAKPTELIHSGDRNLLEFRYSAKESGGTYRVTRTDYPQAFESPDKLKDQLNRVRIKFVLEFSAKNIQESTVKRAGLTGYEFQFFSAELKNMVRYRVHYVGKREYTVQAIGSKDFVNHPKASEFLDSFAVLTEPGEASQTFVPLIDEARNFQAVMLPDVATVSGKISEVAVKAFLARGNKSLYGIVYQDVPGLASTDVRRIAELARNSLNVMSGGNATKFNQTAAKKVKQSGLEATEFDFKGETGNERLRMRLFVVNERVYSMVVAGLPGILETAKPRQFLAAFKLLDFEPAANTEASTPAPIKTSPSEENPEPSQIKKRSNARKISREEAVRKLQDI